MAAIQAFRASQTNQIYYRSSGIQKKQQSESQWN